VQLGYGVEAIVLRVHHAQRLPHTQMELWPDATSATHIDDHAVMGRWLDQVIERLGRHAVVQIQPAQRYLPEETFTPQIVNQAQSSTLKVQKHAKKTKESALPCYPAIRPSRLFNPPEHARVIALVPDSPPAWIHWQGQDTNVVCGYGPERISAPWWNESKSHEGEGDQGGSPNKTQRHEGETRDYFVIHTEPGLWLWVYRDCSTGEWFVHGEWI